MGKYQIISVGIVSVFLPSAICVKAPERMPTKKEVIVSLSEDLYVPLHHDHVPESPHGQGPIKIISPGVITPTDISVSVTDTLMLR